MKLIPDNYINCCVTSPPYYGLRDYNCTGQIGLEKSVEEYVSKLTLVFKEVKRIMKQDGTLWLNLGDSYAGNCSRASTGRAGMGNKREGVYKKTGIGLKPKDLIGIPWRVAFALQADGWYLRQDIIWNKSNPMPEGVTDRCTKAHEYIFLLSKSKKYYFNNIAIKEEAVSKKNTKRLFSSKIPEETMRNDINREISENEKKNKRSVWTVSLKLFKDAHFATYPPDLIEPCILAGCPENGIVFDPFMGSGTTAIVSSKNNRQYLGTDISSKYCLIAEKRILNTCFSLEKK